MAKFLPLCLVTFLWISATVLRVWVVRSVYRRFDSRCQLDYRITHRLIELIQFPPTHAPVERRADLGAAQPELNVLKLVDHGVLAKLQPGACRRERGRTLIIVRRTLTQPKTAFAGVILETSFARFMASMAAFSEEMTPSRPFGGWELASMVETGGDCGKVMQCVGCEEGSDH